ncbi:MAG: PAS domain-containing protein [Planctomycetes bacterium]|nr:PAS domain-containing protein [Planctomycetota bacterium]
MKPADIMNKPWWPSSKLLRGESVIATIGLALAAILLAVMGGTAYWTLKVHRSTLEDNRTEQIESVGSVLAETIASLMSANELSVARKLLADSARSFDLERCRVLLADGQVVANADASRVTTSVLPDSWEGSEVAESQVQTDDGFLSLSYPLVISGRGNARLEIAASIKSELSHFADAQAGVGIIGAVALIALLFVYRHMRSRFGTLGMIREALLTYMAEDADPSTLVIKGTKRAEAEAWNAFVQENARLKKQVLSRHIEEFIQSPAKEDSKLDIAVDEMWHGLILVDNQCKITYVNGAAAAYLSKPIKEILGYSFAEIAGDPKLGQALNEVISTSGGNRVAVELDTRDDGAGAVLRFTMRPLRRGDKGAAVIIIEDVTQQRVADESRSAFVTQVTHELRAPLTNIRLCAETVIDDNESDPQTREQCLNVINQEAMRLERVVNDMLSVAEIEAGSIELKRDEVKIEALFEEMKIDYAAQADAKNTSMEFNLPPKLPSLQGDREKLALALHNLLSNAIKYTTDGGAITINVDVEDNKIVMDFIDNGIGISDEDLKRIFERFSRAKDPRVAKITGSGLGLSLAREIIRLHGGDIKVQSQLDKGSTFSVSLPVQSKAA